LLSVESKYICSAVKKKRKKGEEKKSGNPEAFQGHNKVSVDFVIS
jgi:hypothetical protein